MLVINCSFCQKYLKKMCFSFLSEGVLCDFHLKILIDY
jgi:hypothetical protein